MSRIVTTAAAAMTAVGILAAAPVPVAASASTAPAEDTTASVCDTIVNMVYGPTSDSNLDTSSGSFNWTYELVNGGSAGCTVTASWGISHYSY